jgi:serine/threonine protein kinase
MTMNSIPIVDPKDLTEGLMFESSSAYRLKRRLGKGGMGEVWLAERVSAGKHSQLVAVKFLSGTGEGDTLAEEALRMSRLSHDNIVPFVDSGRDEQGRYFVAMAYVEGIDLQALRELVGITPEAAHEGAVKKRIPDPIIGFVMFMVLRALHHAHTYDFGDGVVGLIHRDVSPGNILIDEESGFVKLTDFGVAVRQSSEKAQGQLVGKIPYMAPEVLIGDSVDTRADIYSLGLVAYELLTGFNPNLRPFEMVSAIGAITNVMLALEKPLRAPNEVVRNIDPKLSFIVSKMLEKAPEDRYASAEAVMADLTPCLYDHGVGPTTASLASYLHLLRNPGSERTLSQRRVLSFLEDREGNLDVSPGYYLCDRASDDLARQCNPGRDG